MQTIVKGTFYRLIYMVFSFLTGLLISGLAGKELFGTISLFSLNAALLILISGMGHDASLYWHRSSGKLNPARALGYGWLVTAQQLIFFLLASICSWLFFNRLLLSQMPLKFFPLEAAYFTGLVLTERYIVFFYSSGKATECNKILSLLGFLTILFPASAYLLMSDYVQAALPLFCIIPLIHGVVLMIAFHIMFSYPDFAFPRRSELSSLFNFSFIVFITNVVQFLAYRIDYWMINYFTSGKEQVGLYAQASRFAQLLWVIPNIIAAIIYHELSLANKASGKAMLLGLIRSINLFNLLFTPLLVLATWIFVNFFLSEYIASFRIFLLLLLGIFLFCYTILLAAYFSASKQLWINLCISICCLMIIAFLDLLFIPAFGIEGAAWAQTIAYGASGLTYLIIFSIREKVSPAQMIIPRKSDLLAVKSLIFKKQ
jgi:O-antigen/teichoic acid export membrane protein